MTNHHHASGSAQSSDTPDFFFYRERAHHERSQAINRAVAGLWSRITCRRPRDWVAQFWNA